MCVFFVVFLKTFIVCMFDSTIVDATHVSQTGPASSGEKSETDIVYLPPYRPPEPLNKGKPVIQVH